MNSVQNDAIAFHQTCEIDRQLPDDPIEVVFGQVPPSLAVTDQSTKPLLSTIPIPTAYT